ncbi:MAG: DUF6516 family protein [Deltaproteobacteria bacterium]|nr:DUF6516 family protein [Deltaproteobacteria bacterium]
MKDRAGKAGLLYHEKKYFEDGSFREFKIWGVPQSPDKPHGYKYSFVYIVNDQRVIGYDNAEGRGDHRHYGDKEYPYEFQSLEKLWQDFASDVVKWREGKR